jgi:hypothetical protein
MCYKTYIQRFCNIVRTCKAALNFDVRNHKAGEDTNTLITEFREGVGSANLNYAYYPWLKVYCLQLRLLMKIWMHLLI